jgi:hypothetical protein
MKLGAHYEQFAYEKLCRLFPEALVTLNDKIIGRESKIDREIDVSIRIQTDETELLYVVQCKDWANKVDINTLGTFSAVMQDVGAAKGFLLCTSGFRASNHAYALSRGIELVRIEDIASDKWRVNIEIPFIYIRHFNRFALSLEIAANDALIELNRDRDLELRLTTATPLRASAGAPPTTLEEYLFQSVRDMTTDFQNEVVRDLTTAELEIVLAGIWVRCPHLSVVISSTKTYYLKYLSPTEYSQLRDHVRGTTLPLHCKLEDISLEFDDTFVETSAEAASGFPGLRLEVTESNLNPADWVRISPVAE